MASDAAARRPDADDVSPRAPMSICRKPPPLLWLPGRTGQASTRAASVTIAAGSIRDQRNDAAGSRHAAPIAGRAPTAATAHGTAQPAATMSSCPDHADSDAIQMPTATTYQPSSSTMITCGACPRAPRACPARAAGVSPAGSACPYQPGQDQSAVALYELR